MAGLFDAFPAFSRMGARRQPRTLQALKAWRRLTPSRRRKGLMLGCGAAICCRLVERGHVQMALYVLLGLSAFSRPITLLATGRCDLVKPAKGGSRFWALKQHAQEKARPSKTQRYDEGCQYLSGLEDLFLAMSSAHDQRPIWYFTYSTSGQRSAELTTNFVTQAPAWTWLVKIERWMLFRNEELGRKQRACTGTNTAVESQQTTENWLRKSEHSAKNAKNTFDKSCWGRGILCIEYAESWCCCAKRAPRRLQRLSPTWKAAISSVEPIWSLLC